MTVGELIGILIQLDQDAVVKQWDYNPGEGWFRTEIHDVEELPQPNEFAKEVAIV